MTCPSTLTCARYSDAALAAEEAAVFEHHLAGCARCRDQVAALTAESQALRVALQAAEVVHDIPAFTPRPTISRLLSWLGWSALVIWLVNLAWISLSAAFSSALPSSTPQVLSWLTPDALGVGLELVFALLLQLAVGDEGLLSGLMDTVQNYAVVVPGLLGFWWLLGRRLDRTTSLCVQFCLVMVVMAAAPVSHAFEIRRDEQRVTVPAGEVIDDTLIVVAENVLIEGRVTGDLIVFGEQVRILGVVDGLLIAGAEELSVEAQVGGSVLGIGEKVDFRDAPYGANLYGLGQSVTVYEGAVVNGNALLIGAETELRGQVGRDLLSLGKHFLLAGNVVGNARLYGEGAELAAAAEIGGDVTAVLKNAEQWQLASGATIGGSSNVSFWPEQPNRYTTFGFYLGETLKLLAALLTGLVLFQLFPALRETRLDGGTEVLIVAGLGAVALVATPVLTFIVVLTLIGAPLGIVTFLCWMVSLYLAGIITAGHVGRLLLDSESRGGVVPLLAGLVILFVLINLPFVGGPFRLLAVVIGLGLIVQWLRGLWAERNLPSAG